MKRKTIIIIVLICLVLFLAVLYVIDMNRIKNNKYVIFSTWGRDYIPPVNVEYEKIELAISDFLLDMFNKEPKQHDDIKYFTSLKIFLTEEKSSSLYYVYTWVLEESYYLEDGNIKTDSGSSVPYKFTIEKIDNEYIVTNSQIPRDGSYYAKDIKLLFPKFVVEKINNIHVDGTLDIMSQEIQRQVDKYYNNKSNLTLEIVREMVALKGENLVWSDFEKYNSTEIGAGLYILLYEIDETYNLMIGGIPTDKPMYIRLVLKKDSEQYIDIRYENLNDFIRKTQV